MIVPVMAISNLVLTRQIYSEETNGTHAHYREPVPLKTGVKRVTKMTRLTGMSGVNAWLGSNSMTRGDNDD